MKRRCFRYLLTSVIIYLFLSCSLYGQTYEPEALQKAWTSGDKSNSLDIKLNQFETSVENYTPFQNQNESNNGGLLAPPPDGGDPQKVPVKDGYVIFFTLLTLYIFIKACPSKLINKVKIKLLIVNWNTKK